jgi:hypothetical protein
MEVGQPFEMCVLTENIQVEDAKHYFQFNNCHVLRGDIMQSGRMLPGGRFL